MTTVLLTILIFVVMIMIHEIGHFIVAKLCGVKVNEFALGMGPKLFSFQRGETLYAVRALPVGGFVSMEGEDDPDSTDNRAFCNQRPWKRFLIVSAGAFMNLVLGLILLLCVFGQSKNIATNEIALFQSDAVSSSSGLQVNDTIKRINGRVIWTENDILTTLLNGDSNDGKVSMVVERDGEKIKLDEVQFQTQMNEDTGKLELYVDFLVKSEPNSIPSTLSYSVRRCVSFGHLVWYSFVDLITGKVPFSQMSGPVGVGGAIEEVRSFGLNNTLVFIAFLTINIGIFNLLPIPALDGGRLFFILVEMIFRKPINRKYEAWVHSIGIILLFGLMIIITLKDIVHLF